MPTPARTQTASPALVWLAILILYVVWGSTYLGIRVAVETIPPFVMASTRFFLAGVIMLGAILLVQRRSFVRPTRAEICDSFIVGALLLAGVRGAMVYGARPGP